MDLVLVFLFNNTSIVDMEFKEYDLISYTNHVCHQDRIKAVMNEANRLRAFKNGQYPCFKDISTMIGNIQLLLGFKIIAMEKINLTMPGEKSMKIRTMTSSR